MHAFIYFIVIVGLLPHAQSKGNASLNRIHPLVDTKKNRSDIGVIIECDEPQHAVTPGQVAVLWEHDWCLGSGIIGATF